MGDNGFTSFDQLNQFIGQKPMTPTPLPEDVAKPPQVQAEQDATIKPQPGGFQSFDDVNKFIHPVAPVAAAPAPVLARPPTAVPGPALGRGVPTPQPAGQTLAAPPDRQAQLEDRMATDKLKKEGEEKFVLGQLRHTAAQEQQIVEKQLEPYKARIARIGQAFSDETGDRAAQINKVGLTPQEAQDARNLALASNYLKDMMAMDPEKTGVIASFRREFGTPTAQQEKIPFVGAILKGVDMVDIYNIAKKQQSGQQLLPTEKSALNAFALLTAAQQHFNPGILDQAASVAAGVPSFASEFALTEGVYTAGRKVGLGVLEKTVKNTLARAVADAIGESTAGRLAARAIESGAGKYIGREAEETAGQFLKRGAENLAGWTTGGLAQSAVQPTMPRDVLDRMTPKYIQEVNDTTGQLALKLDQQGEDFPTALVKAFGQSAVNVMSERSGLLVEHPMEVLEHRLLGKWLQKQGTSILTQKLEKAAAHLGWNGILGEVFEEEIARPFSNAIDNKPLLDGYSWDNLATEFIGFSMWGAAGHAVGYGTTKAGQAMEARTIKSQVQVLNGIAKSEYGRDFDRLDEKGKADVLYMASIHVAQTPQERQLFFNAAQSLGMQPPSEEQTKKTFQQSKDVLVQQEAERPAAEAQLHGELSEKRAANIANQKADETLAAAPEKTTRENTFAPPPIVGEPTTPAERELQTQKEKESEARKRLDDEQALEQEQKLKIVDRRRMNLEDILARPETEPENPDFRQQERTRLEIERDIQGQRQMLDGIARENMYVDAADMQRSLGEQKRRGKALTNFQQHFLNGYANLEADQRTYKQQYEPTELTPPPAQPVAEAAPPTEAVTEPAVAAQPVPTPSGNQAELVAPPKATTPAETGVAPSVSLPKSEQATTPPAAKATAPAGAEAEQATKGEQPQSITPPPVDLGDQYAQAVASGDTQRATELVAEMYRQTKGTSKAQQPVKLQPPPTEKAKFGAGNKLFTEERLQKALADLKSFQPGSGTNVVIPGGIPVPEGTGRAIRALIDVGGYYFEGGVREFAKWSQAVIGITGEWAKPHLKTVYDGIKLALGEHETETKPAVESVKPTKQTPVQETKQKIQSPPAEQAKPTGPPVKPKSIGEEKPKAEFKDDEQQYDVATGKATKITTPNNSYAAEYVLGELSELVQSTHPVSFTKNENFPQELQPRDRTNAQSKKQVLDASKPGKFDPAQLVNTSATPENGPPIATPGGIVLGGNGRVMIAKNVALEDRWDEYSKYLKEHLADFGFKTADLEGLTQPFLWRRLKEVPKSMDAVAAIGRDLNETMTKALDPLEEAIAAGKQVSQKTAEGLIESFRGMGDNANLKTLISSDPMFFIKRFTEDGIWNDANVARFTDPATGGLSESGKDFVLNTLRGAVIQDYQLLKSLSPETFNKMDLSLPYLLQLLGRKDEWAIVPMVRDALRQIVEVGSRPGVNIAAYQKQAHGLFGETKGIDNPAVNALALTIAELGPIKLKKAFADFVYDSRGENMFAKPEAFDSFNKSFGARLDADQYALSFDKVAGHVVDEEKLKLAPPPAEKPKKPEAQLAAPPTEKKEKLKPPPSKEERDSKAVRVAKEKEAAFVAAHPEMFTPEVEAHIREQVEKAGWTLDSIDNGSFEVSHPDFNGNISFNRELLKKKDIDGLPKQLANALKEKAEPEAEMTEGLRRAHDDLKAQSKSETLPPPPTAVPGKVPQNPEWEERRRKNAESLAKHEQKLPLEMREKDAKNRAGVPGAMGGQWKKGKVNLSGIGQDPIGLTAEGYYISPYKIPGEAWRVHAYDPARSGYQSEIERWFPINQKAQAEAYAQSVIDKPISEWPEVKLSPSDQAKLDKFHEEDKTEDEKNLAPPPGAEKKKDAVARAKQIKELHTTIAEAPNEIDIREGQIQDLQYFLDRSAAGKMDANDWDGLMRTLDTSDLEVPESEQEAADGTKITPTETKYLQEVQEEVRNELETIKANVGEMKEELAKLKAVGSLPQDVADRHGLTVDGELKPKGENKLAPPPTEKLAAPPKTEKAKKSKKTEAIDEEEPAEDQGDEEPAEEPEEEAEPTGDALREPTAEERELAAAHEKRDAERNLSEFYSHERDMAATATGKALQRIARQAGIKGDLPDSDVKIRELIDRALDNRAVRQAANYERRARNIENIRATQGKGSDLQKALAAEWAPSSEIGAVMHRMIPSYVMENAGKAGKAEYQALVEKQRAELAKNVARYEGMRENGVAGFSDYEISYESGYGEEAKLTPERLGIGMKSLASHIAHEKGLINLALERLGQKAEFPEEENHLIGTGAEDFANLKPEYQQVLREELKAQFDEAIQVLSARGEKYIELPTRTMEQLQDGQSNAISDHKKPRIQQLFKIDGKEYAVTGSGGGEFNLTQFVPVDEVKGEVKKVPYGYIGDKASYKGKQYVGVASLTAVLKGEVPTTDEARQKALEGVASTIGFYGYLFPHAIPQRTGIYSPAKTAEFLRWAQENGKLDESLVPDPEDFVRRGYDFSPRLNPDRAKVQEENAARTRAKFEEQENAGEAPTENPEPPEPPPAKAMAPKAAEKLTAAVMGQQLDLIPGMTPEQRDAIIGLWSVVAKYKGQTLDQFVGENLASIQQGGKPGKGALFQSVPDDLADEVRKGGGEPIGMVDYSRYGGENLVYFNDLAKQTLSTMALPLNEVTAEAVDRHIRETRKNSQPADIVKGKSAPLFQDFNSSENAVEHQKLVDHINSKDWWHSQPVDGEAYSKRGKFLSSTFKEAEFYGRPLDEAQHVNISNPLVGDEATIEKTLFGKTVATEDISIEDRFKLDAEIAQAAKAAGYDAVVLMSPIGFEAYQENGKIPRSIELNTLENVKTPLAQRGKGAVSFLQDGRAVINAFHADASTFLHESFHVFRRILNPADLKIVENWAGVENGNWTVPAEEKWARGAEVYFFEGQAPNAEVKSMFQKFAGWLKDIYKKLSRIPGAIKLSDEVRDVYSRLLGGKQEMAAETPEAPQSKLVTTEPARGPPGRIVLTDADENTLQPPPETRQQAPSAKESLAPAKETLAPPPVTDERMAAFEQRMRERVGREEAPAKASLLTPPPTERKAVVAEERGFGSKNVLFTNERMQEAERRLNQKLGRLHTGLDASMLKDAAEVVGYYLEGGLHSLADIGQKMIARFGEGIHPYLAEAYNLAKQNAVTQAERVLDSARLNETERATVAKFWNSMRKLPDAIQPPPLEKKAKPQEKKIFIPKGFGENEPKETKRAQTPSNAERKAANAPAQPVERRPVEPRAEPAVRPESRQDNAATGPGPDRGEGRTAGSAGATEVPPQAPPGGAKPVVKSLKAVPAAKLDAPANPRGRAVYDGDAWVERLRRYNLPENAPVPTVRLSQEMRDMLIFPGQPEVVEMALSGLDESNAFVIATSPGTGKTYMSSAILAERKPAHSLILTTSRDLMQAHIDTAAQFGVEIKELPKGEFKPPTEGNYITTYTTAAMREGLDHHNWPLVIADESTQGRRWYADSKSGVMLKNLGQSAQNILYMSATPFHSAIEVGYMDKLGLWRNMGFKTWAEQFGIRLDPETGTWSAPFAPRKLAKLREQLIERGQFVNMDRAMEGYKASFGVVPLSQSERQGVQNIIKGFAIVEQYFKAKKMDGMIRAVRGNRTTYIKNYIERSRLPQAIEIGKKLDAKGWKVIYFSEHRSEVPELYEFMRKADEATGGEVSRLIPPLPSVTGALRKAFGDDLADYSGSHSAARTNEKNEFNNGNKKHIFATYGAGGVGVSLHDLVGDAPRAAVYLGLPWSGIMFDQAVGRPWRFGTKSNVHGIFLMSNSKNEVELVLGKVAQRFESLKAVVSGVDKKDPLVDAMQSIDGALDYEFGNEQKTNGEDYLDTVDTKAISSYQDLPIGDAADAMNKGMQLPEKMPPAPPPKILYQDEAQQSEPRERLTPPPSSTAPEVESSNNDPRLEADIRQSLGMPPSDKPKSAEDVLAEKQIPPPGSSQVRPEDLGLPKLALWMQEKGAPDLLTHMTETAETAIRTFMAYLHTAPYVMAQYPETAKLGEMITRTEMQKRREVASVQYDLENDILKDIGHGSVEAKQVYEALRRAQDPIEDLAGEVSEETGVAFPENVLRAAQRIRDEVYEPLWERAKEVRPNLGYLNHYATIIKAIEGTEWSHPAINERWMPQDLAKDFSLEVRQAMARDPYSPYLRKRRKAINWNLDIHEVMNAYVPSVLKVIHDTRPIWKGLALVSQIPQTGEGRLPLLRQYAERYLRTYAGVPGEYKETKQATYRLARHVVDMHYNALLQMNPKWALVNLSQSLQNTWPDVGANYVRRGVTSLFSDAGRELVARAGILSDMPLPEGKLRRVGKQVLHATTETTEFINRAVSYLASLEKAKDLGMFGPADEVGDLTFKRLNELAGEGVDVQKGLNYAYDAVAREQFMYTNAYVQFWLRDHPILGMFKSFPVREAELVTNMLRNYQENKPAARRMLTLLATEVVGGLFGGVPLLRALWPFDLWTLLSPTMRFGEDTLDMIRFMLRDDRDGDQKIHRFETWLKNTGIVFVPGGGYAIREATKKDESQSKDNGLRLAPPPSRKKGSSNGLKLTPPPG